MVTVKRTRGDIDYLVGELRRTQRTVTRTILWKIPHKTKPEQEDVQLKIGRYNRKDSGAEVLASDNPRSVLTLDNEEFLQLVEFLSENYEPFRKGEKRYIPLEGEFDEESIEHLKAIFNDPDKQRVLDLIVKHNILPDDVVVGLQSRARREAVLEFSAMLQADEVEQTWQAWFKRNDWVLGTEFVRILDERQLDPENIADFLMQAYDGFLDIVEIKRPGGNLHFWAERPDHGNYVPSTDLIRAVTQATKYIYELEREANSVKSLDRVDSVRTVKPRCTLVFGRSSNWNAKQMEAYRILNASYHSLSILTYDHVLDRARRLLNTDYVPEPVGPWDDK